MKMVKTVYQCKQCDHMPFQTKYGLAKQVSVKHEKKGTQYKICKRRMVDYHISDHLDLYGLTNRYHCKDKSKVTGGECDKQYKQLLGIRRHLKQDHKGKMLKNAKVHILEDNEMRYESADKFKEDEKEKQLTGEEVNRIVMESGEVLVVE